MTIQPRRLHAVPDPGPIAAYSVEFKAAAVARTAAGEPVATVAREVGIARNTLKAWIRAADEPAPPPPAPVNSGVVEAAAAGDRRATLVALRTELAANIARGLSGRDLPAHVRLLDEMMREIQAIDTAAEAAAELDAPIPDEDFNAEDL